MAPKIRDDKTKWNTLVKAMGDGSRSKVVAGLVEGQIKVNGEFEGAGQMVTAAAANEYGTRDGHIPERPAFRAAFKKYVEGPWARLQAECVGKLTQGISLRRQLVEAGGGLVEAIVDSLRDWLFPANAESTAKAKGFNKPLTHTRATAATITFKIRSKLS